MEVLAGTSKCLLICLLCIIQLGYGYKITKITKTTALQRHMVAFPEITTEMGHNKPIDLPFFPRNIEELASDITYCIKVGLMRRYSRMRIDVRFDGIEQPSDSLDWLFHMIADIYDEKMNHIHLFMHNTYNHLPIEKHWKEVMKQIPSEKKKIRRRLRISSLDKDTAIYDRDEMIIIFEPINLIDGNVGQLLDNIQSICLRAAMRSLPILMINPQLITFNMERQATFEPFLLGDFVNIYRLNDRHVELDHRQRLTMVRRLGAAVELYHMKYAHKSDNDKNHSTNTVISRIKSFDDGFPEEVSSIISRMMLEDPSFRDKFKFNLQR
jgi:hypothetical protein